MALDEPSATRDPLDAMYQAVLDRAMIAGVVHTGLVARAVCDVIRERVRYAALETDALMRWMVDGGQIGSDRGLGAYVRTGVGNCRVLTEIAAALLRTLRTGGHVRGEIAVDRNPNCRIDPADSEGHAWVRHTDDHGRVVIIDVARGFAGPLSAPGEFGWNYARPDGRDVGHCAPSRSSVGTEAPGIDVAR